MMKKLLAVVLLCLPSFGQAVYWGVGHSSGSSVFSVASSGAPQTYSARVDNCITGAESGCVVGSTTGQSGSALAFVGWDSDPLPFQPLDDPTSPAVANTCFTDPDFGTYQCFVTDQSFKLASTNFNLGDGGGNRFSVDENFFTLTNTGSIDFLVDVVPSRFKAHTCASSPSSGKCFVKSQIESGTPNSTHFDTNAYVAVSRTESNTFYETTSSNKVYKVTITQPKDANGTPTGLDTITRTLVVDFTSDVPVPCSVLPPDYHQTWNSAGTYVFAEGGGGSYQTRDWNTGGTGVVTTDTFIRPVNNNPGGANGNWMYQATVGQTSGTEPNWAGNCPTKGSTCTDGAVTWTNVGNISGQSPAFHLPAYDPGHGCSVVNTYTGKVFRGTGNTDPGCPIQSATACGSQGDMMTDDWLTCDRLANVSVAGTGARPCRMLDRFGFHAGGGSGAHYATLGPTMTPPIFPGGSCVSSGMKLNPSTGPGKWDSATVYAFHDLVFGSDANWYIKKTSGSSTTGDPTTDTTNWSNNSQICYGYIWDRYTTMVRPLIGMSAPTGVSGGGFSTDAHNIGGYVATYRSANMFKHYYEKPVCDGVDSPTGCLYEGAANPGDQMDLTPVCNDSHPSFNNAGLLDLPPAFFPHADVPAWPTNYTCSSYMEETALAMDKSGTVYRFGHNWNTGNNPGFGGAYGMGTISPQGDMLAYGSDFMNSRGDTNGATTCAHKLRAMYPPAANATVTYLDTMILSATRDTVYQVTGCGTNTPGATCQMGTLPNWSACTTTCTSGGATITNLGPNTCRVDIAVMDVLSAHPVP